MYKRCEKESLCTQGEDHVNLFFFVQLLQNVGNLVFQIISNFSSTFNGDFKTRGEVSFVEVWLFNTGLKGRICCMQ